MERNGGIENGMEQRMYIVSTNSWCSSLSYSVATVCL